MDQLQTYGVSGGALGAVIGLARWLYVLLVRGLASENRRLSARLVVLEAEVETYRKRAFEAEDRRQVTQ